MRIICGWCLALMQDGPPPTSHGMCTTCGSLSDELIDLQADFCRAMIARFGR